ncbi:hypothetical protein AGJ35_07305 [Cronobacter dublinensis subsp. dublinensis]|nr:hypothetical protein [Cronobacter dublinensis subsp. dublinensis]EGT5735103.1 hypothetical protein [Cronobacter dublinensis subsp. dublinensis]
MCQQNRQTSIQLSGIYNRGEKRQTKIKKTSWPSFQHGNLCYAPAGRIIILIFCNIQRLCFMQLT